VNTGHWGNTSPAALNAVATALGSTYNTVPAAYVRFTPLPFQRPAS